MKATWLFAEITHSRVSLLKRFASCCSHIETGTNSHQQSCDDYVCCLRTLQKDTVFVFLQPRWKTDSLKCCWVIVQLTVCGIKQSHLTLPSSGRITVWDKKKLKSLFLLYYSCFWGVGVGGSVLSFCDATILLH